MLKVCDDSCLPLFASAPPRDFGPRQRVTSRALGDVALQQWKQYYMQDHLPARRDCSHCLRAQGRSRPRKRVEHPEAFTLSLDLSGKLTPGKDQEPGSYKYLLVGVYTYPVTKKGKRLIPRPGEDDPDEQDQPLPGLDEISESDHQLGYGVGGHDEVPNEQRLPPGDGQAH